MSGKKESGFYVIADLTAERVYVGASTNLDRRHREHQNKLRNKCHPNKGLQQAFEDGNTLMTVSFGAAPEELSACERILLEDLQETGLLYNERSVSHFFDSRVRERISQAMTGKKQSPEHVESNRRAQSGKQLSPEHAHILKTTNLGRTRTPEQRAAIGKRSSLPVSIQGKTYPSIREAAKALDLNPQTVHARLDNKNGRFDDWIRLNE